MKFNNLMNQKKYTISVWGSVARARVSTTTWTVSLDGPVAGASVFFFAWGGRGEWYGGGEGGGGGPRAECVEERSMRVEILS